MRIRVSVDLEFQLVTGYFKMYVTCILLSMLRFFMGYISVNHTFDR